MSFTSGALLRNESIVLTQLFLEMGNWESARVKAIAENRLRVRTLNASQRLSREVLSRLKLLTQTQLDIVIDGSRQDQGHILWLAVCKRYRFIRDFAAEVVREKFLRLDYDLSHDDYDRFFRSKAEWHSEVERVSAETRGKQRQVVFKMLREAELVTNSWHIPPALLSPRVVEAIRTDSPGCFTVFPVSDADIREWVQ